MEIRKAQISDIDDIMNVEYSSFIEGIQEEKSVFIERIKRCPSLFLVFIENKKVCGYLSAEIMQKIPKTAKELELGHIPVSEEEIKNKNNEDKNKNCKNYIYISSFAILPELRGGGVGKKCWEESIKILENNTGLSHFLLLVNEEWKGAFHIYEKNGFKTINTFSSFFVSKEKGYSSGILMEK